MADAVHDFADGTAEIEANPPTREKTRFTILIASKDTAFLTPYANTPGGMEIGGITPDNFPLLWPSAKWRMGVPMISV